MGRIRVKFPVALVVIALLASTQAALANTQSQQHYSKGLIPFQAGQWESAYASFTNATKADPDDALAPVEHGAREVGEALVVDHAAREADQDWSEGCSPLQVRDIPFGRGGGAA